MKPSLFALACTVTTLTLTAPATSQVTAYSQDFESLGFSDPNALSDDGWAVFGNVFSPAGLYLYGYGIFPAPNGGPGFSSIATRAGGNPELELTPGDPPVRGGTATAVVGT